MQTVAKKPRRDRCKLPPLVERERSLVAKNLGLARFMANRWSHAMPHLFDEVHDAALDGLIMAARDWVPEQGPEFSTMACVYMRNEIRSAYKFRSREARNPTGSRLNLDDERIESESSIEPRTPGEDGFAELIEGLNDRERKVLTWIYLEGLRGAELAKIQGVSRSCIYQIKDRAIAKLRDRIAG
jgi:RNA polymerase sigma factor (sigma-70 family)